MEDLFPDISKYYAAQIAINMLTIGKIVYSGGGYIFARDKTTESIELVDPDSEITRTIHVIGEVHPLAAVERYFDIDVRSCLFLNENDETSEIEVRSIHKGMSTAIYVRQQCPMILWNPNYEEHLYFDVIDVQNVFPDAGRKAAFVSILAESLRAYELFPPLVSLGQER